MSFYTYYYCCQLGEFTNTCTYTERAAVAIWLLLTKCKFVCYNSHIYYCLQETYLHYSYIQCTILCLAGLIVPIQFQYFIVLMSDRPAGRPSSVHLCASPRCPINHLSRGSASLYTHLNQALQTVVRAVALRHILLLLLLPVYISIVFKNPVAIQTT